MTLLGGAAKPENWGALKTFAVGQVPLLPATASVLSMPRLSQWRVPRVQSLIVSCDNEDVNLVSQQYFLRWVLISGAGSARTRVVFDAIGFTRVAVPLEQLDLSLAFERWIGSNDTPAGIVKTSAYLGDGSVSELEPGPTFTTFFTVPILSGLRVPYPVGASRFRILGQEGSITQPWSVNFTVDALQGNNSSASWKGARAPATLTEPNTLHALSYTGDFIPLPAGTSSLLLSNADAAFIKTGFVQFGLDL